MKILSHSKCFPLTKGVDFSGGRGTKLCNQPEVESLSKIDELLTLQVLRVQAND